MISLPGISCLWEPLILSFWGMAIRIVGDHKLQCVPARFSVPWCAQQVECGICAIFMGTCISLGKYCAYDCFFLGCPKRWGDLGRKSIYTGKEEVQVKIWWCRLDTRNKLTNDGVKNWMMDMVLSEIIPPNFTLFSCCFSPLLQRKSNMQPDN